MMLRGLVSTIWGDNHMSEAERRVYQAEKEDNFRWVSQLFAYPSPVPLTSDRIQPDHLQNTLSEIGQFAEVAHGSINPKFVWEYMQQLSQAGYPLENYSVLSRSSLLAAFRGTVADLQGYIAHRPDKGQLVVSFSGTSSLTQAFQNVNALMVPHPSGTGGRVHSGFWSMYSGIRTVALSYLTEALVTLGPGISEVVFTGHSMGAVISYLFCLDVLEGNLPLDGALRSKKIRVVAFGSPRVGDYALAQRWSALVQKYGVVEHSIRNYKDGVPTLPPQRLGYHHISASALYLAHGRLWSIPPAQSEYSLFTFEPAAIRNLVDPFPFGGHNYYNGRDMELLQRRMKWFGPYVDDDTWDDLKRRFEEQLRLEREAGSRTR